MNKDIKSIGQEINAITSKIAILDQEKKEAEEKMGEVVRAIATDVADTEMEPLRVDGKKNMFVKKFSDFVGKPLSSDYHNWNTQAEELLNQLSKISPLEWKGAVEELLAKEEPSFKRPNKNKFMVNKDFLQKVYDTVWGDNEN